LSIFGETGKIFAAAIQARHAAAFMELTAPAIEFDLMNPA
jgi:hypothetical protein